MRRQIGKQRAAVMGRIRATCLYRRFPAREDYRYIQRPSRGRRLRVPKGKRKIEIARARCRVVFPRKV